jgi:glucose-1-phosphate cytidylyltransferase
LVLQLKDQGKSAMKVMILAGGLGTRLSEETGVLPKPMVEVGGRPILWHIMKCYSHFGFNDFIILLGYKGYCIKEFFANYFLHQSDVMFDLSSGEMKVLNNASEPWKVTLLDTGIQTLTGGRIKRAAKIVGNEPFLLTYGDGVSNINVSELVEFHKLQGKLVTITSVQPDGRFGAIEISDDNIVSRFSEKPKGDGSWVNAGFFVCEPQVFNYIEGDNTAFEQEPLETLAANGQLVSYRHEGFWKCMDTLRDKIQLNEAWNAGMAEWKVWNEAS